MTEENAKFNGEFIHVCFKIEIKAKIGEKRNKRDIWKRKFLLITQNFTISKEKIHSIQIQITEANVEFNDEFNDICLKIEIKAKIGEQKRHLQGKI